MPESLYGAHPKKLPVRFKLPSHLDLLRFQRAKVKVGSAVYSVRLGLSCNRTDRSAQITVVVRHTWIFRTGMEEKRTK